MKRAFFVTALGIGGGQAITLLASPWLARIYSPAQFGVYATVMALSGVVAAVSALRFDAAIPAAEEEDILPLLRIAIILPVIICSFLVLATAISVNYFNVAKNFLEDIPLIPVAFSAAFQGMFIVFSAYFVRAGNFEIAAIIRVLQPVVFTITAILSIVNLESAFAIGWIFAAVGGFLFCKKFVLWNKSLDYSVFRRNWRFPALSVPMTLLDSLTVALPLLLIVSSYGNENAGLYSQIQRIIGAPLLLVGMVAGQVFYKYAGDRYRSGEAIFPLMRLFFLGLSIAGVVLLSLSFFFGEQLVVLLLGSAWEMDRMLIIFALIPTVARMSVSPVSSVFLISRKMGTLAFWQVSYFVVTFSVLSVARANFGFDTFIIAFACTEIFSYAVYIFIASYIAINTCKK